MTRSRSEGVEKQGEGTKEQERKVASIGEGARKGEGGEAGADGSEQGMEEHSPLEFRITRTLDSDFILSRRFRFCWDIISGSVF